MKIWSVLAFNWLRVKKKQECDMLNQYNKAKEAQCEFQHSAKVAGFKCAREIILNTLQKKRRLPHMNPIS